MKIKVAKSDLDSAIQVANIGLSNGGGSLDSHFVFRYRDGRGEILTCTKSVGTMARFVCDVDIPDDVDVAFTVEGKRLKQWVGAAKDAVLEFKFNTKDKVVTAKAPKGTSRFRSLDPEEFPFWDETYAKAKSTAKVPASRLHEMFSRAKLYIFDKETRLPQFCVTEVLQDPDGGDDAPGLLHSTDQIGLTITKIEEMKDSRIRIHGKDVGAILAFLTSAGDGEDIEILEHDRAAFFRRGDGSLLSVSRSTHSFPWLGVDPDEEDPYWFLIDTDDLKSTIQMLQASAAAEDVRLGVKFDGNQTLTLSVRSAAGTTDSLKVDCIETGHAENPEVEFPDDGFSINHEALLKFLGKYSETAIRIGVVPRVEEKGGKKRKGPPGMVRIRETRDNGDNFLTMFVWLKPRKMTS